MKIFAHSILILCITGCAMTYEQPQTIDHPVTVDHGLRKSDAFNKAAQSLLTQGFQIQSQDKESGYISSTMKNWKLSPAEADCGTTMGIDYLKDNRTKTEVAFNVLVDDQTLKVKSNIHGEYKPGAADQDITLTCVSRGVIEQALVDDIIW